MKRKLLFVTMLTILMAGCNQAGEQKAIPTCTPTPQAVLVDLAVTNTPVPETTEAPQETETPVPTATNTPMPTNTPTPTATNTPTPTPTNTPTPTPTVAPNMEEFIVRFEPDMYGKEYYDGKGIDKRYFTGGNIAGIISEELTVYTADKKSCGYIKSGAEVTIESKSEEWAAIIVGKRKIYARTEELESVLEQTRFLYEIKDINDMAMYVTGNTVVRDVPNPEGEEIGTLELGQEVTVTGKVVINRSDKIWTQIAYNGGSGYVQKEYLSVAKPTPTSTPTPTPVPTSTPTPTPAPTSSPTLTPLPEPSSKEKEAAAMKVAMEIANSILSSFPCESDWVKVNAASWAVADYCSRCTYTMEGKDYREAYGVFVKGEFSCAGATRALGMVLECMGYEWTHANPNEYTHQWCIVEMDGQMGWADGQGGFAAYGVHPQSIGLPVVIQMNGMPRAVDADGNYIPNTPPEVPEMDYNPVKIQQQTEDAIKASGKNITIVWTSENSLRTEGINYIKSEYSGEEYVMRDVNQIMKKAGLYTLMEYLAVTVEKENAGEITYPQN